MDGCSLQNIKCYGSDPYKNKEEQSGSNRTN